ncbi:hypothetical protein EST38_g10093 [Candolleomyces aberdarensis]|uniref:Uncharacterized protein n=1 Tax=Candolleomyces aberdarensis TaxID=2316362 RepID=A0A4Q2DA06_9AGAR|nr:hypothetical protein EST38_g10093 [Candolleomyces aberdarensis]
MFFKQASNWPNLVIRGLRLLRDCGDDHTLATCEGPFDATRSIFTSLVLRKDTIEGHKIMASLCSKVYAEQGVTDLPSTVPEFQTLISNICKDNGLDADRWEAFFSSIKTVHSFKLPLLFALASSAACLFLPSSIMTKDLNRHLLLQIWQGLGGPRPEQLAKIDHILWRALFDVALGLHPMSTRFRAAFREIESLELSTVGFPDSEWLSGDLSFQEAMQTQHSRKPKSTRLPSPTRPPKPTQSSKPTDTQRRTSPDLLNPVEESTAQASHRPVTRSLAAQASGNQPAPAPVYPVSSPAPRKKGRNQRVSTPRILKARATSVLSTSSEEATIARKRTLSETSEPSATLSMKALKLEDGNRLRVYETIDLTVEAIGPPVIDLTVDETDEIVKCSLLSYGAISLILSSQVRFDSEPFTLRNSVSISQHTARFHSREEAEWFTSLCRSITYFYLSHTKPFFSVLSSERIDQLTVPELQNHLLHGAIVIPGTPQNKTGFGDASLRSLTLLSRPVQIAGTSSTRIPCIY